MTKQTFCAYRKIFADFVKVIDVVLFCEKTSRQRQFDNLDELFFLILYVVECNVDVKPSFFGFRVIFTLSFSEHVFQKMIVIAKKFCGQIFGVHDDCLMRGFFLIGWLEKVSHFDDELIHSVRKGSVEVTVEEDEVNETIVEGESSSRPQDSVPELANKAFILNV